MQKKIIGVAVGFLVWSVLWIGSEPVITAVAPEIAPAADLSNITDGYLGLKLVLSVFFSLVSGYLAGTLAGEGRNSPMILGVLLLLVGIGVQTAVWQLLPLWYHLVFLSLLLPATAFGGRLRKHVA
jgi:hypothetical protein